MKFSPTCLSRAESDAIVDHCERLISERGWGFWAVEIRNGQEFIGFVGPHPTAPELPFSPSIEISGRLAVQHWGCGYATEAAQGALRVGFIQLQVPEIVAFTAVGNVRSRAVMERIGMRHAGEIFEHPSVPVGSVLRTHYYVTHVRRRTWLGTIRRVNKGNAGLKEPR